MRVTPAHRVFKSKRARPRKLFESFHDSDTFVHDMPQSTSLPASVLQTPATEFATESCSGNLNNKCTKQNLRDRPTHS